MPPGPPRNLCLPHSRLLVLPMNPVLQDITKYSGDWATDPEIIH